MIAKPIEIDWNSGLSIFARESFLKSVGDEYGWLGGFDESGQLRCILPYTIVRKAVFRMVRFRVETIPVGTGVDIEEERRFLNSAMEYLRSIGADMVIPATTNTIFRTFPDGADAAPYGTYIIDLSQSEETLWGNLQPRNRTKMRGAMKTGVEIRSGTECLDIAHELIRATLKRSRMSFMGRDRFKTYVSELGDNVRIFVAYCNGEAQGCTVVPFSDYAAYYVYGGSIPKPANGAIGLLHWEAIRNFRGLGVKRYDFVGTRLDPPKGSKQEGLKLFKERFGGDLVRGYLWKYPMRPLKFAIYSLAVRIQRGGDIVDAERHKLTSREPIRQFPARTSRVLLVHPGNIPHYRVPIYSYLSDYLSRYGFQLCVASDGIQHDNPHAIGFPHVRMALSTTAIVNYVYRQNIAIVIDFMQLRNHYLFPTYLIAKGILRRKFVYWGQGRDLADTGSALKNLAYVIEQWLADAIVLYADHLRIHIPKALQQKTFIANNTLRIEYKGLASGLTRENVLREYGIRTTKNIICMGRMQKRKRLDNLVKALSMMNRPDVGLILVGPDDDGALDQVAGENIYKLGPIYGDRKFDLLLASDVYCLPGAVGLSIVDAFFAGLPFVTEAGDESAEIMYLKDGINGFIVPRGDTAQLAQKLLLLVDDDEVHRRFSEAAKAEFAENANIDRLCEGFRDALAYVSSRPVPGRRPRSAIPSG